MVELPTSSTTQEEAIRALIDPQHNPTCPRAILAILCLGFPLATAKYAKSSYKKITHRNLVCVSPQVQQLSKFVIPGIITNNSEGRRGERRKAEGGERRKGRRGERWGKQGWRRYEWKGREEVRKGKRGDIGKKEKRKRMGGKEVRRKEEGKGRRSQEREKT